MNNVVELPQKQPHQGNGNGPYRGLDERLRNQELKTERLETLFENVATKTDIAKLRADVANIRAGTLEKIVYALLAAIVGFFVKSLIPG